MIAALMTLSATRSRHHRGLRPHSRNQAQVAADHWDIINAAVNQTLSRTILTGFTTWIVALILYGFGGAAIHSFAFCLLTGILVGTYSSVYIASRYSSGLHRPSVAGPTNRRQKIGRQTVPEECLGSAAEPPKAS